MTKQSWFAPTREAILECLRSAGVPLTPAELAERLDVPAEHVDSLNRRVLAMERDGQLLPNRKGVLLLASKLDLVAGRVQGHRDGFGFLIPDAGGPDVFLSPREMQKAMHGDRVLLKQTGYDSRGRPEGRIVEVTDRAHRRLVGRFLTERGVHIVVPEDQRIKHDIVIPPGDTHRAQHGQVVTAEIVDPPANGAPPIGRVVEVLGEIEDPGMEIEIAVRKFDVPHQFSEGALEQAAALPGSVRPADSRGRVDLRDVPLVTIDGEDARDFDDAVYCEPIEVEADASESVGDPGADERDAESGAALAEGGSGFRLLVAIADVSHYVRTSDALDQDAAERSTSVYFPRRVIPMLPEKLSNGLCSLNPQVDRLVLVCDAVIDANGRIRAYQFYEAVMHSAARLTYEEVWAMLSGSPAANVSPQKKALLPHLRNLHELYRVLARARERRGAMEIETVETRIVCDPAGRIERIVPRTRNDAHRLIEECMLAANVCAADFMRRSKHPGLYRIHEGPTVEKLQRLREFLRTAGLSLGGRDNPSPRDYAALAVQMRARPEHLLMQTMLLRSMQQAVYSPDNVGHFGLAYDAYTHFTSPIRRYPDLLTHRVIKALLRGERYRPTAIPGFAEAADDGEWPDEGGTTAEARAGAGRRAGRTRSSAAAAKSGASRASAEPKAGAARGGADPAGGQQALERWRQWGKLCSSNERRADEASRDVEAWLKCMYMRERVGEQFAGRITGVAPFGVFVTLNELYVEGMVHVSELGGEYFQYIEAAHELRGERTGRRFRLTDPIDVQVSRVDLEARRMEFRLVQRTDFRTVHREQKRAAREEARASGIEARVAAAAETGTELRVRSKDMRNGRREADKDLPALLLPPEFPPERKPARKLSVGTGSASAGKDEPRRKGSRAAKATAGGSANGKSKGKGKGKDQDRALRKAARSAVEAEDTAEQASGSAVQAGWAIERDEAVLKVSGKAAANPAGKSAPKAAEKAAGKAAAKDPTKAVTKVAGKAAAKGRAKSVAKATDAAGSAGDSTNAKGRKAPSKAAKTSRARTKKDG